MVDLDSVILSIIGESDHPMSVNEVHKAINRDYMQCPYDRTFNRLKSLASHRSLNVERVKRETGGRPIYVYSLVTA